MGEDAQLMTTAMYQRYQQHRMTESDIQHHLGLLFSLAKGNVLELGTRSGVSTAALLAGVERQGGIVVSVDIDDCSTVARGHQQWAFIQGDSTNKATVDAVSECMAHMEGHSGIDFLLIDTFHTYEQSSAELELWNEQILPGGTICMHDTETFPGVRRAAQEFADAHGWPITFVLPCHGMAVITRPMEGVSTEGSSWAMEDANGV
jgi:cephalosporin hydroxylase